MKKDEEEKKYDVQHFQLFEITKILRPYKIFYIL